MPARGALHFLIYPVFLAISANVSAADVQVLEQIIAKVNGDIITRGDFERSYQALRAQMPEAPAPHEIEANALREQIDSLLLIQKGKDLNINVDTDVTRELADIQTRNAKIADPDRFRVWLQEQSGISYEDFREQLRNRQLQQRVVGQEVGGRITISKAERQEYYDKHTEEFVHQEEVLLREIVISLGKTADTRAQDILARARRGERFPELARDTSDGESAKNYGAIGWFRKHEVVPALQEAWPQLKSSYITDIIKIDNGLVIFKVDKRHNAGQAPFKEMEDEITEKLSVLRMKSKTREYLTKLRGQAFLAIREGYVDGGAVPGMDTTWKDPQQLRAETSTKEEVAAGARKRLLGVIPQKSAPAKPQTTR